MRVPADAATITEALVAVAEDGLVLLAPGTYTESVTVSTPGVTLRGEDRTRVVIDGEGLRPNGVQVIADGVRVENLTVVNHTFNGVLVTGMHDETGAQAHNLNGYERLDPEEFPPLQRFSVSHVTASNNGLYGIYAFNTQHGVIADSYTSGSADSGIYVGQCASCDILVTGNVSENNAIGYENANASDSVLIAGNRFTGNRVGLTLISWYQEAYLPQRADTVVGNLIADNTSPDSPAHATGAFGLGIGLSGAQENTITANAILGHPVAGVQINNTEDIPSIGNAFLDNVFAENAVDLADTSAARAPSSGTCLTTAGAAVVTLPQALALAVCPTTSEAGQSVAPQDLPAVTVPAGMSFLKVPAGPAQPGMSGDLSAVPAPLPAQVSMPDPASFPVPDRTFLADRATR